MSQSLLLPKSVWIGENSLKEASQDICALGSKALIVTGHSMIAQGYMHSLTELLKDNNLQWIIFSGISGEPTIDMIEKGSYLYKKEKCDFVIGFGGGSAIDAAKAIALYINQNKPLSQYVGQDILDNQIPIVAIPSTAGTGSEVTKFTIITDTNTNVKMLLSGKSLMPSVAIVNPIFTVHSPESVTMATGLDALTHAVEAYTSKKAYELSDEYALSAIKRIFIYLPLVIKNPSHLEYRNQMSIAAYEAGISFNNSSVTIVHGMSRPIGALFHVPHGLSNAMLLKEALMFACDGAMDRFANIAREINAATADDTDECASKKFFQALDSLLEALHVPTLREYGIPKEEFISLIPKMAKDAMESGSPANTRKTVLISDMEKIYYEVINKESRDLFGTER